MDDPNIEENYRLLSILYVKQTKELEHVRANHDDLVKRCALLRQRLDLPVDRIPAYDELIRLQKENKELKVSLIDPFFT